jgi:hypothetical protein
MLEFLSQGEYVSTNGSTSPAHLIMGKRRLLSKIYYLYICIPILIKTYFQRALGSYIYIYTYIYFMLFLLPVKKSYVMIFVMKYTDMFI